MEGRGVWGRGPLTDYRTQAARAPLRSLATAPTKPAAERSFKEIWLTDPAVYPIVVIIGGARAVSAKGVASLGTRT